MKMKPYFFYSHVVSSSSPSTPRVLSLDPSISFTMVAILFDEDHHLNAKDSTDLEKAEGKPYREKIGHTED